MQTPEQVGVKGWEVWKGLGFPLALLAATRPRVHRLSFHRSITVSL